MLIGLCFRKLMVESLLANRRLLLSVYQLNGYIDFFVFTSSSAVYCCTGCCSLLTGSQYILCSLLFSFLDK